MEYLWLILVLIIVLIFILSLEQLRRKTTLELSKILYINRNFDLYFRLLENKKLKLIYTQSAILMFELDGYLMLGNDFKVEKIIQLLESSPLPKGEKLELNQRKLSFYCQKKNKRKAKEAYEELTILLNKSKNKELIDEYNLVYGIYILHDMSLKKLLLEKINNADNQNTGLFYYRLAKLEYYDSNNKKAREYLQIASKQLLNTSWANCCQKCLEDINNLDEY
ncbi:hypothetical protein [Anaerorhabdus sp.]|uniref:hypothetical protein n=1 Tax=Anaerorhabdus sp. TaxID=1872524 RepID=UPI002FC8EDEB